MTSKLQIKYGALLLIAMSAITIAALHAPLPQDPAFHNFADKRGFMGIPNFWNVMSNVPFLVIGLWGMLHAAGSRHRDHVTLPLNCFVFFFGIFLTGLGSAWYHHAPDNHTLLWDRLPMTISFMAFFSIVVGRFMSMGAARRLLFPLVFIGLASVLYWYITENQGHGDLRLYMLVQFLPMLLIPLILGFFGSRQTPGLYFWLVVLAYAIAKLLEAADDVVFSASHVISGHTLKHFFSELAPAIFLIYLEKEGRVSVLRKKPGSL